MKKEYIESERKGEIQERYVIHEELSKEDLNKNGIAEGIKEKLRYTVEWFAITQNLRVLPNKYNCVFEEDDGKYYFIVEFEAEEKPVYFKRGKKNSDLWRQWQFRDLRKAINDIEEMLDYIPEYISCYN